MIVNELLGKIKYIYLIWKENRIPTVFLRNLKVLLSDVALLKGQFYLIDSEVEPQSGDIASLAVTANVSQLQLEVVPTPICHQNLVQAQTHRSGRTAGH